MHHEHYSAARRDDETTIDGDVFCGLRDAFIRSRGGTMDRMQNKFLILQFSDANIMFGFVHVDEVNQFGKSRVWIIFTIKMANDHSWLL